MIPDRWREVSRIYGVVLTKPESERAAALGSMCANDDELRREVESLLQSGQDLALIDRAATERPSTLGLLEGRAIGSQIGVFRIESLLGVGGMGEVYRARDTKLNRVVAPKLLPAVFASDPERLARFKREAQLLASLNHPNIGAIHGFEGSGPVHALVLELVEGPTLADRITLGPVPIEEALAIARQIADAFECAHEQGIVHRDLKPANIKVRDDGTVKVLDFGLAKLAETGGPDGQGRSGGNMATQSPTITTPAMTAAGMILGTAAYMSPEQAKGKPADKRSDIWAFGCVLYEMLTGERPFKGEDVADTLAAVLRADPDLSVLPPTTPSDSRFVLFSSSKNGAPNLFRRDADGSGLEERLTTETVPQFAGAVLADGHILGHTVSPSYFLSTYQPMPSGGTFAVTTTKWPGLYPALSPDGRFVAFIDSKSGGFDVFIRPFPDLGSGVWPVSTGGGGRPVWSKDGRELYYLGANTLSLWAVAVDTRGPAPILQTPTVVFRRQDLLMAPSPGFDVSGSGRFLLVKCNLHRVDEHPSVSDRPSNIGRKSCGANCPRTVRHDTRSLARGVAHLRRRVDEAEGRPPGGGGGQLRRFQPPADFRSRSAICEPRRSAVRVAPQPTAIRPIVVVMNWPQQLVR